MSGTNIGSSNCDQRALLLPLLEAQRQNIYSFILPVLGIPHGYYGENKYEDIEGHEYESFVRTILMPASLGRVPGTQHLYLVEKAIPHGYNEMMIMDGAEGIHPTINTIERKDLRHCFETAYHFSKYAHIHGLYPAIGYTSDPNTHDVQSGQSIKRFHLQLNTRTQDELKAIHSEKRLLSTSDRMMQRALVDESAIIGSFIVLDFMRQHHFTSMHLLERWQTDSPFLQLRLLNGWKTLQKEEFIDDLLSIHAQLDYLFQSFVTIVCNGSFSYWERPTIIDFSNEENIKTLEAQLDELLWLTPITRELFIHFVTNLDRNVLANHKEALMSSPRSRATEYVYPLAGLCYALTITEESGEVFVSIRPQLFAKTGGNGLIFVNGVQVKLKRGEGEFSSQQLHERQLFQNGFLKFLSRHMRNA